MKNQEKIKKITSNLPESLIKKLDNQAFKQDRSRNKQLIFILRNLPEDEKTTNPN